MGTLEIIVLSVIVVILVFVLTVFQINKSYAYKHSVDPLPKEDGEEGNG